MEYTYDLIHITQELYSSETSEDSMYSFVLLKARKLTMMMNGVRCFLDGGYLLCLNDEDVITDIHGEYECRNLRYELYFININLDTTVIGDPIYESMRAQHKYPDFHLFRTRSKTYFGVIPLSVPEYDTAKLYFDRAERHIAGYATDVMWSCRTRSDMFSILNIAESAYLGVESGEGVEVIRYIKDNVGQNLTLTHLCEHFHINRTTLNNRIKEFTGFSTMAYVMEERLTQVLPDLLFTQVCLADLAEKYGFCDENHFIRAFKKRYGKTPLKYRMEGRAARP
ncbi:MAG: helix-turn-helix transcriptional regulator [Ruminococcaceae bacterium]|nr:helix-turn-helix transcriptional regulator [Oscillospiraceae bacterium]